MTNDELQNERKTSLTLILGLAAMVWVVGNIGLQTYATRKLETLASEGRMWEGIVRAYDMEEGLGSKLKYVLWGPEFSAENYIHKYLPKSLRF